MIVAAVDPDGGEARMLTGELSAALAAISGDGGQSSFSTDDVRADGGLFLVARDDDGALLGCGALRRIDACTGEIKRMYARPGTRGVGAALLAALERRAQDWGYQALWLETRKVNQRAFAFYARHGYATIPNYGKYAGRDNAVCLGKKL